MSTCWICGSPANTGEHFIKTSDISRLGDGALRLTHIASGKTVRVQGRKSDQLKFNTPICAFCNNQRTQPHDLAYDQLVNYIDKNSQEILRTERINLRAVFDKAHKQQQLNLSLYLAKHLGCKIADANLQVPPELSKAILSNSPTRIRAAFQIHIPTLTLSPALNIGASTADLYRSVNNANGNSGFATEIGIGWLYIKIWFDMKEEIEADLIWHHAKPKIILYRSN